MDHRERTQSRPTSTADRAGGRRGRDRRKTVLSILLIAAALLLFLSLVSYTPNDEATADTSVLDVFKLFTGDQQVQARADTARNWLGLLGAIISSFLITSTIGYGVVLLPVVLTVLGWSMLRRSDMRGALVFSNYLMLGGLLLSASFGMARLIVGADALGMQWSGLVGDFLALLLGRVIGRVGGAIALLTALLLVVVLAVDLDLQQSLERARRLYFRILDWLSRMWEQRREGKRLSGARDVVERIPSRGAVKIARPERDEQGSAPVAARLARGTSAAVERESDEPQGEPEPPARPREIRVTLMKKEEESVGHGVTHHSVSEDRPRPKEIDYVFPSVDLLNPPKPGKEDVDEDELKANADLLRDTLAEFDVELESVSVTPGPVVTLYELVPASGVKISRIVSLENDIALKLAAKGIRIMAPIPGKSAVGVEIPNHHRSLVTVRSLINTAKFRDSSARLPLAMGKTIAGEVFTDDLSKMPHLLMAGSTGSGKSVGINTIIASLLYKLHPAQLKFVIVDPKKIELAQFAQLRHHFLAVSPDVNEDIVTTPRNAVLALKSVEYEMEKRYDVLAAAGVRNVDDYNDRVKEGRLRNAGTNGLNTLPYIVVIIDELADLMITAAKEVEEPIARLAQLARAVGIHLVVATQRPSVDVITGVIKANFPARIAYQVASKIDSRTILDMNGAEQLLGNGDMLYLASGSPKPIRLQNGYISPDEVDALVHHISKQQGYATPFQLPSAMEKKRADEADGGADRDELFEEAAHLVVRHQQGSVSLLQRRLKVGYSRAARLVDELEAAGVVGPFDGSKAREVLVASEAELDSLLGQ